MKYIIEFSKTGTICYTSHLDIMKVFKRAFKRVGIKIAYSKGFNPHPKMGFAQPLSLGYWGLQEYVEFETEAQNAEEEPFDKEQMLRMMSDIMPEGLELKNIIEANWLKKTLAAENVAAEYMIEMPILPGSELDRDGQLLHDEYMAQDQIMTLKKQKKKPEPVLIDIKPKIRSLELKRLGDTLYINALLDSGSESNLSPELLINTFTEKFNVTVPRSDMNVARKRLYFKEDTEKKIR